MVQAMTSRTSLLMVALLAVASPWLAAKDSLFPALGDSAEPEWYPGKVVWHDLFTAEPDAAVAFYSATFGWEAVPHELGERRIFIMWSGGYPVAAIIERLAVDGESSKGIWIGYASTPTIETVTDAVRANGGSVLVGKGTIPGRGEHAICRDADGAIFGLIRLASGDPGEYFPAEGSFMWSQHFSPNPDRAATFYKALSSLEMIRDDRFTEHPVYLVSSGGYARAGIGPAPEGADTERSDWIHFVRVHCISTTLREIEGTGAEVVIAPAESLLEGRLALVEDPSGALLGLMEAEMPAITIEKEEVSQ